MVGYGSMTVEGGMQEGPSDGGGCMTKEESAACVHWRNSALSIYGGIFFWVPLHLTISK
jgi:hypothetical protein